MNSDLRRWLKGIVLSAVGAAGLLLGYRFVFPSEWPWWVGVSLGLTAAGLVVGILFLRRFWTRGHAHRVSAAEEGRLAAEVRDEKVGVRFLQSQWNQAIDFIRRSHLKKRGDPLYVLPWFMVIGEKGSGKTTAIQGARLSSFAPPSMKKGVTETQACEWSFFEQAIVIDTAGRYLSAGLNDRDREEWQRLLDLLFRYRKKESLNGLVVTVSADKLLGSTAEVLEAAGQNTRKRIDELMRALGAKFPVYVLVTQGDHVHGMAGFAEHLSESGRAQAMGCLNQNAAGGAAAFVDFAFDALAKQLARLRLVIVHRPGPRNLEADSLMFPDAFSQLQKGLDAFIRGAFQENVYQETPLLRGLYFSGQADLSRGIFLHDFFSKVLPADRQLLVPTQRALEWKKETMNMGLVLWLVLATAAGGLMTYSFARNLSLLRETDREFSHLPATQGDTAADIVALDQLNHAILALASHSQTWWLNGFGLDEAGRVKQALKERLSRQFRNELLAPFDDKASKDMAALGAYSSDVPISHYIEHLVGRIRLLRARLRGETLESGDPRQAPSIPFLALPGRQASDETKQKFGGLYLSSVFWCPDRAALTEEMQSLQARLRRLLTLKAGSPQWVIAWAKAQNSVPPVTLHDYWGGDASSLNAEPSVAAIFSRKCKNLVDSFFGEIETALGDPDAYRELKNQFEHWYRLNALEAWKQFVSGFPQGKRRLKSRDSWRQMAARIPKDEGPYFALLNTVALELEPFAGNDAPAWLKAITLLQPKEELGAPSALSRLGLQKIERNVHSRAATGDALANYRKALEKVQETVIDPSQILSAAAQAFQEGSGPGSSSFAAAFTALAKLKDAMASDGTADPAVLKVLSGPLDFLWEYARRETADRLQTEWEKNVLAQAAGFAHGDAASALLAQDGSAIRFAKDQAGPFLEWKPNRGYYPKTAFGGTVPFAGAFLSFVNSSAKVSMATRMNNVNVTITALAPETNPGSKRIPHSTLLELNCGGSSQVLAIRRQRLVDQSFNIAQKSFAWSPACGDTSLEIDIGSSRLIKLYPGKHGFFDFLKDFDGGTRTFTAVDFPTEAGALSQMGIDWITLPYRFIGAPASMPEFTEPDPVPSRIVQGWGG